MQRSDYVSRGERKVDFLRHYGLVTRWARKQHSLNTGDLELLLYLDPLKYFYRRDFIEGTLFYTWDRHRFYRLQREGWITRIQEGKSKHSGKSKYKVSMKGKLLINRIYKMLIDKEDLPLVSVNMKKETYSKERLNKAINKYNKKR